MPRFIFNYAHFPRPGILFRSSECLKLLTRNHYKKIWRVEFVEKVMRIIYLYHVLQGEVVQVFFLFKHIHWLFSCRVSSSWAHLQCLFIPHKFQEDLSHQYEVKNWLRLWMPSQNAVIIMGWLSILFLYGHNALFQWVICQCSQAKKQWLWHKPPYHMCKVLP